jgi:hypothetical protein
VSVRGKKLLIGRLALVGVIALASASPAFAQSAGVGGNIGTFIQNIIATGRRRPRHRAAPGIRPQLAPPAIGGG